MAGALGPESGGYLADKLTAAPPAPTAESGGGSGGGGALRSRCGSPTASHAAQLVEDVVFELFCNDDNGMVDVPKFLDMLRTAGLRPSSDPRLADMLYQLHHMQQRHASGGVGRRDEGGEAEPAAKETPLSAIDEEGVPSHLAGGASRGRSIDADEPDVGGALYIRQLQLDRDAFKRVTRSCAVLITRALQSQFVIPDWRTFCHNIGAVFARCRGVTDGRVAAYIPQLARADPSCFGLAVCTIDGQRKSWGDARKKFCLQSISKPYTYAVALNDLGARWVHRHVGTEPSGRLFNEICLDRNNKPHNPMVNAGAIICSSLIKPHLCAADRFDFMIEQFKAIAGGEYVGFSNSTFLSERATADRNYALAYYMREHECLPASEPPRDVLDHYFQLCSVEVDCDSAAVMAATLANGGVCPTTGERCLTNQSCRDTLSLMYSCGMYDYSGMFAFKVGLPAKSGVSGGVVLVVPNVCGFCIYSPPLDAQGNSARAVRFCEELVDMYNFHNYDSLLCNEQCKADPRRRPADSEQEKVMHALFAAKKGDMSALKRLVLLGTDLDRADYDGRTALHVAASEGHADVCAFLVHRVKVRLTCTDRWAHTPLDDAQHFGRTDCAELIAAAMARMSNGALLHTAQWAEGSAEAEPAGADTAIAAD